MALINELIEIHGGAHPLSELDLLTLKQLLNEADTGKAAMLALAVTNLIAYIPMREMPRKEGEPSRPDLQAAIDEAKNILASASLL